MASNDSGPPAQRRRKLVLRKIPPPGPLPVVRPPQKSIPFASVIVSPDAEAAAAITSLPSREPRSLEPRLLRAEAPGRPDPAAPQPQQAPRISHAFLPQAQQQEVPVRYARPSSPQAPASETGPRATVAPVVAAARTWHAHAESAASPWARFARASTRASTLLAVGGAVAAVGLFATLGVAVGERSGRPAPSPAGLQAASPVVAEIKPSVPGANVAQRSAPSYDREPAEQAANRAILNAETTTIAAPPAVHPAPATAPAKGPAAAPSGAMSGWAIAPTSPATPSEAAAEPGAQATRGPVDPAGSPAVSAASAPEIAPSPPPAVDPLVQAVREDIREDEARSK